MAAAARNKALNLMRHVAKSWRHIAPESTAVTLNKKYGTTADPQTQKEYAFEMACSNIRYGPGVTQEVGMDCKNMGAKLVCVMTDKYLSPLAPVQVALESLERHNVPYKLYDRCRVEPTDESFKAAVDFSNQHKFDVFLAIGGGSVMDTCKAANLYSSNPQSELLDYVNAPIGKGLPVTHQLKPLIAVTTTAGTGSETTGTAVFDYLPMKAKTGISNRALRPTLGIVDPLHLITMPERVAAYSGIDVLCHAIESYTAVPYDERIPRPENPMLRPAYQGCNPVSDIWSAHALRMTKKYLKRATDNPDDMEARSSMHLASTYAGIGFGNAGCHLCHGMSYPISGLVKDFVSKGYDQDIALVPHGLSVVISAPAVFEFMAPACPERHLEAAKFLGVDITNKKNADAGQVLGDKLRQIMQDIDVPDGLIELGYTKDDIPALVKGTLPQHRVIKLAPRPQTEEDLTQIFENCMRIY
ncbi:hydroxyacid-oxoacid transhydrogenase, mitochondrial-like isoform X2 [Mizuhopecten yessoensis]|uniref:hydroxyacid-oxoacid transhydrogenase, mitochondrial-like isoform X2 n=1 Tax=Mizuhopecten yessoensis TaxID=6573 RepID=UPI000B4573B7|nr:hydroxyacid-oxoacid transhydrogenase, mitochondrial-like isoform X2 [Mizuhopecten yessoensis]